MTKKVSCQNLIYTHGHGFSLLLYEEPKKYTAVLRCFLENFVPFSSLLRFGTKESLCSAEGVGGEGESWLVSPNITKFKIKQILHIDMLIHIVWFDNCFLFTVGLFDQL